MDSTKIGFYRQQQAAFLTKVADYIDNLGAAQPTTSDYQADTFTRAWRGLPVRPTGAPPYSSIFNTTSLDGGRDKQAEFLRSAVGELQRLGSQALSPKDNQADDFTRSWQKLPPRPANTEPYAKIFALPRATATSASSKYDAYAQQFLEAVPRAFKPAASTTIPLLLEFCEAQKVSDPDEIAYMMATVQHECGFSPIKERRGKVLTVHQGRYWNTGYFGRGFVQITWKDNYQKFGNLLKVNLVSEPDLALEPRIAGQICVIGMKTGAFTGVKLADYHRLGGYDFIKARRIINRLDRADLIAGYARRYRAALDD